MKFHDQRLLNSLVSSSSAVSIPKPIERLIKQNRYAKALSVLQKDYTFKKEFFGLVGYLYFKMNQLETAIEFLKLAHEDKPNNQSIIELCAQCYSLKNNDAAALAFYKIGLANDPNDEYLLYHVGLKSFGLNLYSDALIALSKIADNSQYYSFAQHYIGAIYTATGHYRLSELAYKNALEHSTAAQFFGGSYISDAHYNPYKSAKEVQQLIMNWVNNNVKREVSFKHSFRKQDKIRLGLISDGFRAHPVGQMATSTLELLDNAKFELFFYSTNSYRDHITDRLKSIATSWQNIGALNSVQLASKINTDRIDILFDLAGHMKGNRIETISQKPAPIIVKWVGGLINTTGIKAIDYLISDYIETPADVDDLYSEKLIRLPGDYICYMPPNYAPPVLSLPAKENGHISFGCFNNAVKINEVLVSHWAEIMRSLPTSTMFIKSMQLNSSESRERVQKLFADENIELSRVRIEGPTKTHAELLQLYNEIDIALDTWPYSGGLTTCEALYMGVPVVTYPGPTFAGRHSATHIVNAGMPELVTSSWDEYKQRVLELASDTENLAIIRKHLRPTVLKSPLCDVKRFTANFNLALQAIWQRYCDGKKPAPLTFEDDLKAKFDGETDYVEVPTINVEHRRPKDAKPRFSWSLDSRVLALTNYSDIAQSSLVANKDLAQAFTFLIFDPASRLTNINEIANDNLQVFQHADLGNGEAATLFASIAPELSATESPSFEDPSAQVITKLPISTIAVDKIEGLPNLDWLVIDPRSKARDILENSTEHTKQSLAIHVGIPAEAVFEHQLTESWLADWAAANGFTLVTTREGSEQLALHNFYWSMVPSKLKVDHYLLVRKDFNSLSNEQKKKLAFLLHIVYQHKELALQLLNEIDVNLAIKFSQCEMTHEQASETTFELPSAPRMSAAEQKLFKSALKKATKYYEFGSGGSTIWAAKQKLTVFGVESDQAWVDQLKAELGDSCQIKAVDIGPTGAWGYPLSVNHKEQFPNYSRAIFDSDTDYDLVLVDGRFRVACVLATIEHVLEFNKAPNNVRIFVHDFWNRLSQYSAILDYVDVVNQSESALLAKLKPNIDVDEVKALWEKYKYIPN